MDKEQRKFLIKVKKSGLLKRSDVLPEEKDILFFLLKSGHIVQTGQNNTISYKLSEQGKAEYHKSHQSTFRFWFPIILSNTIALAALIISIIALLQ